MDPFRVFDDVKGILVPDDELLTTAERQEEEQAIGQQIAEDTCEKHSQFCCPKCFDTELPDGDPIDL